MPVPWRSGTIRTRARGAADVGVELVGVEHRAVDRQHGDAIRRPPRVRRGPRPRRPRSARRPLSWISTLCAEPARLAGDRGVGGDDQDVVDAAAARQLDDQVEEEGLGERLRSLPRQRAVQAAVGDRQSLHRDDRGRVQVVGRHPHEMSGYRVGRRRIPRRRRFHGCPARLEANSRVRSARARRPARPCISVGQAHHRMSSGGGSGSSGSQIMPSSRPLVERGAPGGGRRAADRAHEADRSVP